MSPSRARRYEVVCSVCGRVDSLGYAGYRYRLTKGSGKCGSCSRKQPELANRTEKWCNRCQSTKPIEAFGILRSRADGRQAYCTPCRHKIQARYRAENKAKIAAYAASPSQVATRARYYEENREQVLAQMAEYRSDPARKARIAKQSKQWYEENRERHRENAKRWAAANPEKCAEIRREAARRAGPKRRMRKLNAAGEIEHVDPIVVLEMDDGICGICGLDVDPSRFDVDHIIPLARGGDHAYWNVQPSHPTCNRRKNSRLPEELAA